MKRAAPGTRLDAAQRAMADRGLKALIPFRGQPFIAYVVTALADAGVVDVCLVVRPGADPVRAWAEAAGPRRVRFSFAVQDEPRGSAHALLAAEPFAAGQPVLVINADNDYPPEALRALGRLDGSGLVGFRADALTTRGNITPERVAAYAVVTADEAGHLNNIVEKPGPESMPALGDRHWISMTCWRFTPVIFDACRAIPPSVRGEYELPDAVRHAAATLGERFRVVPSHEGVLDLSHREDVESVGRWLLARRVEL